MGFVIVAARARSLVFSIDESAPSFVSLSPNKSRDSLLSRVLAPRAIGILLFDQLFEINRFVELICLGSGVANVSLSV
jgi:hypothetical protein